MLQRAILGLKEEQKSTIVHHLTNLFPEADSLIAQLGGDNRAGMECSELVTHRQQAVCFSLGCQMKNEKAFGFCGY